MTITTRQFSMEPGLPNTVELTAQTFLKQEMVTLHVQSLTAAECI